MSTAVDVVTIVVGAVAVATLTFTVFQWRVQVGQFREAQLQAISIGHHARIYAAAADAIRAVTVFTRLAEARIQARGRAQVESGFSQRHDETVTPALAALLDEGATMSSISSAHDDAHEALMRLWFFIPRDDDKGTQILGDIYLLTEALGAVRPIVRAPAGEGGLEALVADAHVDDNPMNLVDLDVDPPWDSMTRLRVVRELATKRLRNRIGASVQPPPIAQLGQSERATSL